MSKLKVLIATNPLDHEGGVVNYFRLFLSDFETEGIDLVHVSFGSRMKYFYSRWKKLALYPLYYVSDYIRFGRTLLADRTIRIVQVNPSLIPVPLIRDAFILLGARLFRRRAVVFFRGWKENVVLALKENAPYRWLFRLVYGRADIALVLASRFRDDLVEIGFDRSSIITTTTVYDAREILPSANRAGSRPRLIFLGRVSQLKGMDELIDAAAILVKRGVDFECAIVGHEDKEGVIDGYAARVNELGLDDRLEFLGRLAGREKFDMFANSDIYVLPSWTEGCPNSVLEALGAGLFVVSTDTGALPDIIDCAAVGRTVPVKDTEALADELEWACENIEELRNRRADIQEYALRRFEARKVFAEIGELYEKLIDE